MVAANRIALGALAAALTLTVGAAAAQNLPRLEPVDEGPRRPDFLAFRTSLQEIIARRDVPGLLRVVHPKIRNSFGGDDGVEAFRRLWRLDQADSELWRELGSVLTLGGVFEGPDTFVAPYVFARWPDDIDPFEHVAVVGTGVRVRSAPGPRGRVVATLSYEILRLGSSGYRQEPWTSVLLRNGRRGFVASHLIRSSVDYRAYFTGVGGEWLMMVFIAGD